MATSITDLARPLLSQRASLGLKSKIRN